MSYVYLRTWNNHLATPLRVARRTQTYRNVLYLIASFPLGVAYLVFLATGLAMGASLLVVLIGIPILLLMHAAWWRLAGFERELAIWWLDVDIPPMLRPRVSGQSWWGRARAYLTNGVTWTSLVYLLLKFPLGVLGFVLAMGSISVTSYLVATPVVSLVKAVADGRATPGVLAATVVSPFLGIAVLVGALYLLNGLALVSGQLARIMLGSSDTARRLHETEALAEREQAKAERAEQSRRELIVNVSHELRTPAASIRGHVESLLLSMDEGGAGSPAPGELRSYLGIVHRETERLNALVDELLSLARAESGELRLEIGPVAVGDVVEEVCQSLAPLARRERLVTVVSEVAPRLPPVLADRQRLGQVLLNLVRNAITYTPEGGIVSITVERADTDRLALTVADTGIGIPPEDLDRVFERFYRTDESRARTSGGFGLGLAIVRDLVEAMGGAVSAHSVVGEGSSFRVLLRVAP